MTTKCSTTGSRTMGASRKHDPRIPAHIDQRALPKGVYWDPSGRGRWYTFIQKDGKRARKTLAGPATKLSQLHALTEVSVGPSRGTVEWLCEAFHASPTFIGLSALTRADYNYCRGVVLAFPARVGVPFGQLQAEKISRPNVQRIIDALAAAGTPTKANKVLRYLRRLYRWGINRGLVTHNPAQGVEAAKERKRQREPSTANYIALLEFAKSRGQRQARSAGSVAPYLWLVMELGYLCRLRGIETITLTEAHASVDGIRTNRRKGSRDNLVEWTPRLRAVWEAALTQRQAVLARTKRPEWIAPTQRVLFLSEGGEPLSKSGLDTAWQRLIHKSIEAGVITEEQRFSLHDLKRKGGTDTPGNRADKQDALGVSEAMMKVYDKSVPRVKPSA